MHLRTALQNRVRRLFHYQPFHLEYLNTAVRGRLIRYQYSPGALVSVTIGACATEDTVAAVTEMARISAGAPSSLLDKRRHHFAWGTSSEPSVWLEISLNFHLRMSG